MILINRNQQKYYQNGLDSTNIRLTNIKLEEEIEDMIDKFDAEMFRLHTEIEELRVIYETEKLELEQARQLLGPML